MANAIRDKFEQFLHFQTVQSAANTLTFGKISMGMSLFDYAALIISRVEYHMPLASYTQILTSADIITMAITGSDSITDLDIDQPQVYDKKTLEGNASGTPGNFLTQEFPLISDYSNMVGGGVLVPAQDIFLGVESSGLSSAATVNCRVYFRIVELAAGDFIEIAQRLRVLST